MIFAGELMDTVAKHKPAPFSGFYKLSQEERYQRLLDAGILDDADVALLKSAVSAEINALSDGFVENAIGSFPIPLGVVPAIPIDGREVMVPMAVEETSIIAALSNTAKWVRSSGEITTETVGNCNLGQIYFSHVSDIMNFITRVESQKLALIACVNQDIAHGLVKRGGGVKDIHVRTLLEKPGSLKAVVHVLIDTCDAMGANIINQACEYLKHPLEELTGESVAMCIVSNMPDTKITRAQLVLRGVDEALGKAIEEASLFAELDPYRASTSNKGVMNGIDAVLIATGNDWRAVESGVHAYAARSGQYRSITRWRYQDNNVVGEIEAPIITGVVGGVTKLHPMAQMAIKMLGVSTANELSRIVAATGLLQNLGAIRALMGDGIVKGHMRLHIKNLILSVDATDDEKKELQDLLEVALEKNNKISHQDAQDLLAEIRAR
jgi:hydroxymethylglutaryl-CoA reductase